MKRSQNVFFSHYYADLKYEKVPPRLEMEGANGHDITANAFGCYKRR